MLTIWFVYIVVTQLIQIGCLYLWSFIDTVWMIEKEKCNKNYYDFSIIECSFFFSIGWYYYTLDIYRVNCNESDGKNKTQIRKKKWEKNGKKE